MKACRLILIAAFLLLGLPAFGQITANNGTCYAATTSCTFGGTATGSIKIVFAFDNGTNTAPSLPGSGWTTIASGTTGTGGVPAGYRIGCNISSSGSDTGSGTWTSATSVSGVSYPITAATTTGTCLSAGIGIKLGTNAKASTTVTYSALASMRGNASSWAVGFMGDSASSLCLPSTVLTNSVLATGNMQIGDTNAVLSSFTAKTCTVSSSTWMSYTLELLAPTIPTPTMNPNGGSFGNDTVTTFSDGTAGVTYCSTLDGSTPTSTTSGSCAAGTAGGTTTVIATGTSVKVLATKAGLNQSAVLTGSAFTLTVATPTATDAAGTYNNDLSETISDTTTSLSTLVYCTDTVNSCTPGTTYSAPVAITATATYLRASATKTNYVSSAVMSRLYTLTVGAVTDSPGAGTYTSIQSITLGTTTTTGATVHYTTDNTAATCSSTAYSGAITGDRTEYIRAVSCKTNYNTSAELNHLYTLNVADTLPARVFTLTGVSRGSPPTIVSHVQHAQGVCSNTTATGNVTGGCASQSATSTFSFTPTTANDGVVLIVSCGTSSGDSALTGVSLAASGWSFTQLGGITGTDYTTGFIAAFKAYAPNTSAASVTATWTGPANGCGSTSAQFQNNLIEEFAGMNASDFVGNTTCNSSALVCNFHTASGTTSCNSVQVTPSVDNSMLWAACNDNQTAAASTWTKGADDGASDIAVYKLLGVSTSGVAVSPGFGSATGAGHVVFMVSIKP